MKIQPYLFFEGHCEEAIAFYRTALGAEVTLLKRYKDGPDPGAYPAGLDDKVMHANLRIGDSMVMCSDGCCKEPARFKGFALSFTVTTLAEAEQRFNALAEGGKVTMPLTQTFWSPYFGMVTDRFGVLWMIDVGKA